MRLQERFKQSSLFFGIYFPHNRFNKIIFFRFVPHNTYDRYLQIKLIKRCFYCQDLFKYEAILNIHGCYVDNKNNK